MHGPMHGLRLQPHGVSLYGGMGMLHGQHLTRLKSIALRNRTTWTCFARNRQRAVLSDQYGKSQMNIVGTLGDYVIWWREATGASVCASGASQANAAASSRRLNAHQRFDKEPSQPKT